MEVERVFAEVACGLKIGRYVALARSASRARRHRVDKENSLFATETLRFTTHAPLQHSLTMCTDTEHDYLNALRAPEGVDAKATVTLKYGPYMN